MNYTYCKRSELEKAALCIISDQSYDDPIAYAIMPSGEVWATALVEEHQLPATDDTRKMIAVGVQPVQLEEIFARLPRATHDVSGIPARLCRKDLDAVLVRQDQQEFRAQGKNYLLESWVGRLLKI